MPKCAPSNRHRCLQTWCKHGESRVEKSSKSRRRSSRVAIAFYLIACSDVQAVSFAEIVDATLQRLPDSQLADAERDLAGALDLKARQPIAGDPTFNLKYQTDAIGSGLGYREWEGGVDMPLWWPGQAREHQREAERTLSVADAMARANRLEVAGEVRERVWTVALAESEFEQASSALSIAQELAHDVKRRVAAGELPRTDLLLAEQDVTIRVGAVAEAQNRLTQAQHRYGQFTGINEYPDTREEQPQTAAGLPLQHPRLVLADAEVARARAHRDRVGWTRRSGPNVWIGAKSARSESRADYESAVGVEFSIPLGSRTHHAPALAEAEKALTGVVVVQERMRRELDEAVELARLEQQRATAAEQVAQRRHELATASHRISRRAFELGETDLVRLLQVQADAIDAQHDLHLRRLEVRQAVARLNQALGVIPQ